MNLLRLPPPLSAAGVAVEAELTLDPQQRVQVRFRCEVVRTWRLAGEPIS